MFHVSCLLLQSWWLLLDCSQIMALMVHRYWFKVDGKGPRPDLGLKSASPETRATLLVNLGLGLGSWHFSGQTNQPSVLRKQKKVPRNAQTMFLYKEWLHMIYFNSCALLQNGISFFAGAFGFQMLLLDRLWVQFVDEQYLSVAALLSYDKEADGGRK